jgi:hypothetical protein
MANRTKEITYQKMIDNIIQNFDFDKCQSTMLHLSWDWYGRGIPTVNMLKESSIQRLRDVIEQITSKENRLKENVPYYSMCGGLKATGWKNRYGHVVGLELEFVLTQWDSDGDY